MKIGVVTPHRQGREVFDGAMRRMVQRQTRPPDEYVVVDYPSNDLSVPDLKQRVDQGIEVLHAAGCKRVYIMEDDDYYAPTYIATQERLFPDDHGLTGLAWTYYYHVLLPAFHKQPIVGNQCGLNTTRITPEFWFSVRDDIVADNPLIDRAMWLASIKSDHSHARSVSPDIMLAVKHGVGQCVLSAHRQSNGMWSADSNDMCWLQLFLQDDPEMMDFYWKLHLAGSNATPQVLI